MSLLTVSGTLTIRERLALGDAVATVKLVDAEGDVLAAAAWQVDAVPLRFSLTVDPEVVSGDLFVWAMLRAETGGWGTLELVPAESDEEIVLSSVDG